MRKIILIVLAILIVITAVGLRLIEKNKKTAGIGNFSDCAEAGFPVQESYPRRCSTPDGRLFTEYIGNQIEYDDLIRVETPRPNDIVKSPIQIKGMARGSYFFEANFSAELYDSENKLLGTTVIIATADWMTEEFLPFAGELTFDKSLTKTGKLILRNGNPSGLPEYNKELIIPVQF